MGQKEGIQAKESDRAEAVDHMQLAGSRAIALLKIPHAESLPGVLSGMLMALAAITLLGSCGDLDDLQQGLWPTVSPLEMIPTPELSGFWFEEQACGVVDQSLFICLYTAVSLPACGDPQGQVVITIQQQWTWGVFPQFFSS